MNAGGREIDVAPVVMTCVHEDIAEARNLARPWLTIYFGGMGAKAKNFYVEMADKFGSPACTSRRYPGSIASGRATAIPRASARSGSSRAIAPRRQWLSPTS
ncbi:MAG: hypothetical protein H0T15_10185 [Thermoleophilaceae bacterium]|nr:hypothetical protein [Thermoleophilaceae bacterium]